jgi:hypothetical protein
MDENEITIIFTVTQIVPDKEPYKPSAPVIACNFKVAISVPLQDDLIVNADFILSARKLAREEPEPVFTIKGLRFVENVLLSRQDDKVKPDPDSIEWSEEPKQTSSDEDDIQWADDEEFEF